MNCAAKSLKKVADQLEDPYEKYMLLKAETSEERNDILRAISRLTFLCLVANLSKENFRKIAAFSQACPLMILTFSRQFIIILFVRIEDL